ncbi:uncharacterized protein LOC106772072 isoform X2 [Vigna radiata var. radiata]|uniref:Uncharacterized protein LOC106772072 isoform X2 n=1 Tax=Vigna radiata var. radiata TaxID=3916 RepID=A0A1S3V6E2_VIGRR|nr:uncharacterized protein LOC106772072 isoform X2 [Vigna radiata var. radiata]
MVKMSSENKKIKPKADIELVLNYSNPCIWKNLNNDSCAGANAACKIDKTFSATDPLSEIVWSPDKGFSLKCVDSSYNKKSSLFRDFEPSSMVLAVLQSVTDGSSARDKPENDVFVEPIAVICSKNDVSSTDTPSGHPSSDSVVVIPDHKTCQDDNGTGKSNSCRCREKWTYDTSLISRSSDNTEKINIATETLHLPNGGKEIVMNDWENNLCAQADIGTAIISDRKGKKSTISGQIGKRPISNLLLQADEPKCSLEGNPSTKHCNAGTESDVLNKVVEIEDGLCTRVEHVIECNGSAAHGTNLISSGVNPLPKLESTTENDLQTFNCESKSNEKKTKSTGNEMMLLRSKNPTIITSPCNKRIRTTTNEGKEKSLSGGDSNVSLPKENDFHLSGESCRSSGLILAGKKRSNFQQVIIGSKKLKKHIQETSCSKSYVQPDSSFMNLVSNMLKICSQSTEDESKSLDLNLENPNHHLQQPDQKLLTCNMSQDPKLKNAGFRSNFQSVAGAKFKNVGARKFQVGDASKDFELRNKVHGTDVAPITFYAENNSLYRRYFPSNNKLEVSEGRLRTSPINSLNSHEHWVNNSLENENYYKVGITKEKEGTTSLPLHSPSIGQNRNNNENAESNAQHERREICHKSETVEGLWINRFLPKSSSPSIVFDHLNERGDSGDHSTSFSKNAQSHKHISLTNYKIEKAREQSDDDQLFSEAQNLHKCCINEEDPTVLKDTGSQYQFVKHKFNSITPFPGLRDSRPMVSMFARTLGAIKQYRKE